jgi:O-antigen/teichoic acid export membrane protein
MSSGFGGGGKLFSSLIRNIALSAFAYFVISILGIWVTGALVSTYGLTAFGLITLVRLFSASGLVGLFDLGTPENASHVVARARATSDWAEAIRSVQWLALFAFIAAMFCTLIMLLFTPRLGPWLGVDKGSEDMFQHVLLVSAIVLPLCLTSLVAEGVIRGFEKYEIVRGLEVFTSVAYAMGAWFLMDSQQPFSLVIYLYLALTVVRALVTYSIAWVTLRSQTLSADPSTSKATLRVMLHRTWLVGPNKILATLQTQSVPLVIGLMVGVTGAAVYDLLMRLPRFVKSALGLLNSAVLPFASRLDAANSRVTLRTLYEHGLVMIAFLAAPPLFALAVFSEKLLHHWVGDMMTQYCWWQSLAFSTPLITVIVGFASMSMFSKTQVLELMSLMVGVRLVVQYAIAWLFIGDLGERAFILGTTLAVLVTAVWELKLLLKLQDIDSSVKQRLFKLFAVCGVLGAAAFPATGLATTLPLLLFGLATLSLVSWFMVWMLVIPEDFQRRLISNIKSSFFSWSK